MFTMGGGGRTSPHCVWPSPEKNLHDLKHAFGDCLWAQGGVSDRCLQASLALGSAPEAPDLTPSISDEALETFWSIIDNTDAKVILGPVVKTRPELALFLG